MEESVDFLPLLNSDMSFKILTALDDPSDLVRASCVSRSWREFVIRSRLCREICLTMFPQLAGVDHVTEPSCCLEVDQEVGSSNSAEWENLKKEHRVYAFLAHCSKIINVRECISEPISASSTDNYPREGVHNTLQNRDIVGRLRPYWSSKGQKNPDVPETLIYKLVSDLCVITEIGVKPFQAYFQTGLPIYSSKSVRFRMGHARDLLDMGGDLMDQSHHDSVDEKFAWTYTSPEFPMAQESRLQIFKLPQPVLCVGGFVLIELLGRVQRQEIDDRFYICVSHVKVLGRPLSSFRVEPLEPSGSFVLKLQSYYMPEILPEATHARVLTSEGERRARYADLILNMLNGNVIEVEWDEEQELDEEQEPDEELV